MENGANKEVSTFLGDTPSSLALSNGHTNVSNWLDTGGSGTDDKGSGGAG